MSSTQQTDLLRLDTDKMAPPVLSRGPPKRPASQSRLTFSSNSTPKPHLSQLALDILSIPAMSAEPERLFSATKLIISDSRNKLSIKMIESLACLKSWYKLRDVQLVEEELFVGPRVKEDEF